MLFLLSLFVIYCLMYSVASYYVFCPTALRSTLDYLILSTYTLEHLIIYCECLWWQTRSLFSLFLFFLGVTVVHHVLTLNKVASIVLAWLYSLAENAENHRVVRRTAGTIFVALFLALNLINRIFFWITGKLIHSSRADLRRLYQRIPLINHRPWGIHFDFLHRFRMWLYRFNAH